MQIEPICRAYTNGFLASASSAGLFSVGVTVIWLSKLLRWVPKDERQGIEFDLRVPHWIASNPKEFPAFFRALVDLVPDGSIAYLEGGFPPEDLESFLKERSTPEVSHVAMGTIWPRPKIFHMPATPENLLRLAEFAEHCAEPEVAIHFHVYRDNTILLEWFDVFDNPMYISMEIPEKKIIEFCKKLGIEYKLGSAR